MNMSIMNKVNTAFSKTLEDVRDFKKALLDLPQNKTNVQKALIDALTEKIENSVLSAYELATFKSPKKVNRKN